MYAGRIVEQGSRRDVFYDAQHPYTWGLLGSIARLDRPKPRRLSTIPGLPPSLLRLPDGCAFGARCAHRFDLCDERPALLAPSSATVTWTRCHLDLEQEEGPARDHHPSGADRGTSRVTAPPRRRADATAAATARGRRVAAARRARDEVLPDQEGDPAPARGRAGARGGRRQPRAARRGDARPGRGVRVRQVHAGPVHRPAVRRSPAARSCSRARTSPRLSRRKLRPVRRELQMVFQDPYASLNPRKRVGTIISDPLRIHKRGNREQIKRRVRRTAGTGRALAGARQPLPARVLRRSAAADRCRPGARAAARS